MITPPRVRRDTDTEERDPSTEKCPQCVQDDPDHRSRHYLSIAKFQGIEAMRKHIHTQFVTLREPERKRPDIVDNIMAWVTDLVKLYRDLAHPETGTSMAWHEARAYIAHPQQRVAIDEAAFARAPESYTPRPGELEPWIATKMRQVGLSPSSVERRLKHETEAAHAFEDDWKGMERQPGDELGWEEEPASVIPPATLFPEEPPYTTDLSMVDEPPDQLQETSLSEEHLCHALGCTIPIEPRMFMHREHWYMVPQHLRNAIWRYYRKGQEVDKRPSEEYLKAAKAAIAAVALREGREEEADGRLAGE